MAWTSSLVLLAASLPLLGCDTQRAGPSAASEPTSSAARYAQDARAALVVAFRHSEDKANGEDWWAGSGVLIDRDKGTALTSHGFMAERAPGSPLLCLFVPPTEPSRRIMPAELDAVAASGRSRCSVQHDESDISITVLHLEDVPSDARAVELAARDPEIGDEVYGVFAPHGVANTWLSGYVNNRRIDWPLKTASSPLHTFGVSIPLARSANGGMVLDEYGHLVGIVVMTVVDAPMGLAVPVSLISERLAKLSAG